MAEQIKDGTGTGYLTKVDEKNRIFTRTISSSLILEAANEGDAIFLASGGKILTSANASALFYYQNDEAFDVVVARINLVAGESTDGTNDYATFAAKVNPTGMTSGSGSAITQINNNFGSAKTFSATSESGQEGASLDGGTSGPTWLVETGRLLFFDTFVIIPQGKSVGIQVTPPPSNTSMLAAVSLNVIKKTEI